MTTATARLVARHGVFDQVDEEYLVLDGNGIQQLDDWTPAFSVAAEEYERLTGRPIGMADCQVVDTNEGEYEFTDIEPICGDESCGIANMDGRAYEFYGTACRKSVGSEWDAEESRWVVVKDGDEERWEEIDAD